MSENEELLFIQGHTLAPAFRLPTAFASTLDRKKIPYQLQKEIISEEEYEECGVDYQEEYPRDTIYAYKFFITRGNLRKFKEIIKSLLVSEEAGTIILPSALSDEVKKEIGLNANDQSIYEPKRF